MRRLTLLIVVALVGAALYGASGISSGVVVDGQSVPASTVRSELAAIEGNANLACYLGVLSSTSFARAGGDYLAANAAAAWTSMRVEGAAVAQYVTDHFAHHLSAAELAQGRSSLEAEMTTAATNQQAACTGTSAQALDAMPAEMSRTLVADQSASLYLVGRLNATIPLTAASLQSYYQSHQSSYDKLCVSVALVAPTKVSAFIADAKSGASVLALVKKYSVDPASVAKGGADGCYDPTSQYYLAVRSDVGTAATGSFSTTPHAVSVQGATYALFVAATSRTVTPFARAEAAVYSDVQSYNAQSAGAAKSQILYRAAVAIDPSLGRWGLGSSGPGVFATATPPKRDVATPSQLTSPSTLPYQ